MSTSLESKEDSQAGRPDLVPRRLTSPYFDRMDFALVSLNAEIGMSCSAFNTGGAYSRFECSEIPRAGHVLRPRFGIKHRLRHTRFRRECRFASPLL